MRGSRHAVAGARRRRAAMERPRLQNLHARCRGMEDDRADRPAQLRKGSVKSHLEIVISEELTSSVVAFFVTGGSVRLQTLLLTGLFVSTTLISSASAQSQITTGVIQGVVTDTSGGVVPGVNVEAKNLDTNLTR